MLSFWTVLLDPFSRWGNRGPVSEGGKTHQEATSWKENSKSLNPFNLAGVESRRKLGRPTIQLLLLLGEGAWPCRSGQ
jgi:hypothetical protein